MHLNVASIHFDEVLANHEAHTNALAVYFSSSLEFAKETKKLGQIFLKDSLASVFDMHSEHLLIGVVGCNDAHRASDRELESILCQIDQDLLQTEVVS